MAVSPFVAIWIAPYIVLILYGINTAVFATSLCILLSRGFVKNTKMIAVTSILYLIATLHNWFTVVSRYLSMFYSYDVLTQSPENIAADYCGALSSFVGNLVLIHRLWVIWGRRNWIAIPPLISSLISLISLGITCTFWAVKASTDPAATTTVVPLVTDTFLISYTFDAVMCLSVTSLIVTRIWWMSRGVRRAVEGIAVVPKGNFGSVRVAIEVSVESGVLITFMHALQWAFYKAGSKGLAVVGPASAQIYALAPILLIVRVGLMGPLSRFGGAVNCTGISTIRFAPEADWKNEEDSQPPPTEASDPEAGQSSSEEKIKV